MRQIKFFISDNQNRIFYDRYKESTRLKIKDKIIRTCLSLFFPFFPAALVMFVLWLSGHFSDIALRSDLMLVASILFAESAWKSRSQSNSDQDAIEILGFIGAIVATILTSLILLKEISILPSDSILFQDSRFYWAMFIVYVFSIVYAITVRWRESCMTC